MYIDAVVVMMMMERERKPEVEDAEASVCASVRLWITNGRRKS